MSARMGPKYAFPTDRGFGPLYGSSDLKPTNQKKFVEGDLPFETYFAAADTAGLEYFIAEHDNPPQPYLQSIETSYNSIKAMRF